MRIAKFFFLVCPLSIGACVGGSKDEATVDQAQALKAYVLDKEPGDVGTKLNINYDNKLTLLGSKVEPSGTIHTGDKVKVNPSTGEYQERAK